MKTIALVATLMGSAATFAADPQKNTKFPPDRHAAIAAMLAAD